METKPNVFLSHATKNADVMKQMADYLERIGYNCWYFQEGIAKGNNYLTEIVDAIDKVDVVILLHSQEVHHSKFVFREIDYALDQDKLILPVLLDDSEIARNLVLMIRSIQMTPLSDYASIELAADVLDKRMQAYQAEKEQGTISTEWLKGYGTPVPNGSSASGITSFLIKDYRLARIKRLYVPVENYEHLLCTLTNSHVAVFQSPKHSGKYSTGLHLLTEIVDQVIEMIPTFALMDFMKMPLKHKTGYLINNASISFFEKSSASVLENIQERLRATGSFLIITSDEKDVPDWAGVQPILFPKDKQKILTNHLEEAGIQDRQESVIERISPLLKDLSPYEIAQASSQLVSALQGTLDLEDLLTQLGSKTEEKILRVFQEHSHSVRFVSQFLTLAILKEVPEKTFLYAANLMRSQLEKSWPVRQEDTFLTDSEILEMLGAIRFYYKLNTDIGYVSVEHVRLVRLEESESILRVFWNHFRFARIDFLEWFDLFLSTAKRSETDALLKILPLIASFDFQTVRQDLIQKWAMHESIFYRLSAVRVLTGLVKTEVHVQEVIHLVNSWASQKNNVPLQWTASAALGTEIGVLIYPKSLNLLKKGYTANPKPLSHVVKRSYRNLFQLGTIYLEYDLMMLEHFKEWLASDDDQFGKSERLYFIYSLLRKRKRPIVERVSEEKIAENLSPVLIQSFKETNTRWLAEDLLGSAVKQDPDKLAKTVFTLLYHENKFVSERTKLWLKSCMSNKDNESYIKLYKKMALTKGGN